MNYSKGISWIDDCRIPFVDEKDPSNERYKNSTNGFTNWGGTIGNSVFNYKEQQGRFPANLLVSDDMLNDGSITKSGFNPNAKTIQYGGGNFGGGKTNDNGLDYSDKGSNSRYYDIDTWFNNLINYI